MICSVITLTEYQESSRVIKHRNRYLPITSARQALLDILWGAMILGEHCLVINVAVCQTDAQDE